MNKHHTAAEDDEASRTAHYEHMSPAYRQRFTRKQWIDRRYWLKNHGGGEGYQPSPFFTSDKKVGTFSWREANRAMDPMHALKDGASWSQDFAEIVIPDRRKVRIATLSDTHIGAWSTDHHLLEKLTDEILDNDLMVILVGDLAHLAIKMGRSVVEMADNLLPPHLQHAYVESWLEEIKDHVLFACWGNHEAREEHQAGTSGLFDIIKRRAIWFNGIGHANVRLGTQVYKIAVSHHFQGRSIYNPVHGPQRYLMMQGHDREIAIAGDSHVPGMLHFTHGGDEKLAINTGSIQINSGYSKRFFSLITHPIYPCFTLSGEEFEFEGYWSVKRMLRQAA